MQGAMKLVQKAINSMRLEPILQKLVLLIAASLALISCATVDLDYPKETTSADLDTEDTHLGRLSSDWSSYPGGESGFLLFTDGIDALGARLLIAQRAECSIDAQYYLITNDRVGYLFIALLLKAADRGVRERLLLDDIQTQGYDPGMAALDSHPNFEVRIFNPFGARGARAGSFFDFSRVNRRMHNKSFTADKSITMIGGRNIAEEYFSAKEDVNFDDVDVLAVGPVVQDVSNMFDAYWNSTAALPVPAFAKMPDDPEAELVDLRERIDAGLESLKQTPYRDAVQSSWEKFVGTSLEEFSWAPYELVYDSPDKADKQKAKEAASIVTPLRETIVGAKNELTIVSPYFVPLKQGIELLGSIQESGVQVSVITNSLAATNHSIVHSGYAPSRKPLLKKGVKIYEVRRDASIEGVDRGGSGAALATLHAKAFVVDRQKFFLGSFNLDPRSININTELGVIVDSAEISGAYATAIDEDLDAMTYEVILNDKDQLRWVDRQGEEEIILSKEPQTSWWQRFSAGFMRILPVKSQL
jgi:putative cardiolipin synthase